MSAARRLLLALGSGDGFVVPNPPEAVYALFNGYDSSTHYRIGAATKVGTWSKDPGNPVIDVGSGGTWDDALVKDPWLMHVGGTYVAYYSGDDGSTRRIGRATASAHTGTWTKYGSNPVLSVGSGGAWDDTDLGFPTVLYEPSDTGREWKMWYGGSDGTTERIGYAYSSDGLNWTKHGQVLDVGAGGTWEDVGLLPGAVINVAGTYHLFYVGRQGTSVSRWQGGVATFTDPEGTYTKDAGNPVILARFNDSGTSKTLTSNASSGATTLAVADTTGWNVGEPIVIADADSDSDVRHIASIDSGTQVTLDAPLTGTFTTANGAVARPFAFNSILPRTVRLAPEGGYEAFCTPFQPLDDLSPGGSTLREGAMRMTAPSLFGPWSYDYDTGLLWPLGGASDWDRYSAENPSVIPAP